MLICFIFLMRKRVRCADHSSIVVHKWDRLIGSFDLLQVTVKKHNPWIYGIDWIGLDFCEWKLNYCPKSSREKAHVFKSSCQNPSSRVSWSLFQKTNKQSICQKTHSIKIWELSKHKCLKIQGLNAVIQIIPLVDLDLSCLRLMCTSTVPPTNSSMILTCSTIVMARSNVL